MYAAEKFNTAPSFAGPTADTVMKSNTIQGTKYKWQLPDRNDERIKAIAATHSVSQAIAATLYNRGYHDDAAIRDFLFSTAEKDVADTRLMKGAPEAVARLLKAIEHKERILVFGDYDVDGITSTAILLVSLLPLGANINFFLPNRVRDGYGLSSKIVEKAVSSDYNLIITVDNGISAHRAARTAQKLGIDLIITDHHRPHASLPPALSIVNPNQPACKYPHKSLAGVGVTFKIVSLLYQIKGLTLPEKVYELLMLGTIADVVPLLRENRYWVRHGLAKVNKQQSYAMHVLANNASIKRARLDSLDIGFMIAPQLNALGRLDDPRDAVKFLISSHKTDVERVGATLKQINEERKRVDRAIYNEVNAAIQDGSINLKTENLIMAANTSWPAGVIGLVAGKLMHNYGRPSILFHITKDGIAKGSCRSIPEFNMFDALAENEDLLTTFGGHSMAAGLSLPKDRIPELKKRIEEKIAREVKPEDLQPRLKVDATLELVEMDNKLLHDLAILEPFGNANPRPTFTVEEVVLQQPPKLLKDAHVKCVVFADGVLKPVIFFNRPDLYRTLSSLGERSFTLAGHVTKNEWQGRTSIELQGSDISLSS